MLSLTEKIMIKNSGMDVYSVRYPRIFPLALNVKEKGMIIADVFLPRDAPANPATPETIRDKIITVWHCSGGQLGEFESQI